MRNRGKSETEILEEKIPKERQTDYRRGSIYYHFTQAINENKYMQKIS